MSVLSHKNLYKKNRPEKLALIGMSGVGKSFWSKRLVNNGFRRFSCDDLIAERLGLRLSNNNKSTLNLANRYLGNIGFRENECVCFVFSEAIIGKNTSLPWFSRFSLALSS